MVYTIALFALWPWGWATDLQRMGTTLVVSSLSSLTATVNQGYANQVHYQR